VIGGRVLTLYCVTRFGLEYHRSPSGYEIVPSAEHEGAVPGKEA
jgi:hypothetical protein